ncbi:OmpA family protein [Treponema sp.]|uniref:OmpA family protein n=1 Tax=Treponema sp. TaxID=166 RepID=UPI00388E7088
MKFYSGKILFFIVCMSLLCSSAFCQKKIKKTDFESGEELFQLNKPEEAIVYFEKALELPDVNPNVYIYLGVCYYQIEQYDKSLAICVRGMAQTGTDKKILAYNAGNSCYAMGNYMRAEASYAIAIKEDENYSPAVLNIANAQLKLDHLEDSRENYIRYLELETDSPQKERIETIIQLLEGEINRRANEKPELINPDSFIENEQMEVPENPEKVVEELPAEEEKSVVPSELVKEEAFAPKIAEMPKKEIEREKVNHETEEEEEINIVPVPPEFVGSDAFAPEIPPDQLRLEVKITEKTEPVGEIQKNAPVEKSLAVEKVGIEDEIRRFEEERKQFEAEKARLEMQKKLEEAEKLRLEEENKRKAVEAEAARVAEEARKKAEMEEKIAAEKRALEEERRNFEKAKLDAEIEAQRRALEEEKRKIEDAKKAMEEERRIREEAEKKKAEENARIEAERRAAEEAEKQKAEEEARNAELASWPYPKTVLNIEGAYNFTPDGDGQNDIIIFSPSVEYLEKQPESWILTVLDPQGNIFKTFKGRGVLPKKIDWDGKSDKGETVLSKNTYTAKLTVKPGEKDRERLGDINIETAAQIQTGLLLQVIVPGKEWKMVVNSINFVPNAALDSNKLSAEQNSWNSETLDEIAEEIKGHPGASVVIIEGYANNISGTDKENREELVPLSQLRADAIVDELVKRGVSRELLQSKGMGGANALADKTDRANWYKNRRVEFRIKK